MENLNLMSSEFLQTEWGRAGTTIATCMDQDFSLWVDEAKAWLEPPRLVGDTELQDKEQMHKHGGNWSLLTLMPLSPVDLGPGSGERGVGPRGIPARVCGECLCGELGSSGDSSGGMQFSPSSLPPPHYNLHWPEASPGRRNLCTAVTLLGRAHLPTHLFPAVWGKSSYACVSQGQWCSAWVSVSSACSWPLAEKPSREGQAGSQHWKRNLCTAAPVRCCAWPPAQLQLMAEVEQEKL